MKKYTIIFVLATAAFMSGCNTVPLTGVAYETQYQAPRIKKLSAIGYGAPSSFDRYADGQKRLMAMRASKLDAYRSMAEQVYGVRVTGGSTVSAMMVQNDSFRVSIDAYVRGAHVTNVTQMADGNYETTIEMEFDENVVRSFALQPVRTISATQVYAPAYVATQDRTTAPVYAPNYIAVPIYSGRGSVGPGAAYGSNYYFSEQ